MLKKSEVMSDKYLTIMCLLMPLGLIFFMQFKNIRTFLFYLFKYLKKRGEKERDMNVNGSVDFSLTYSLL